MSLQGGSASVNVPFDAGSGPIDMGNNQEYHVSGGGGGGGGGLFGWGSNIMKKVVQKTKVGRCRLMRLWINAFDICTYPVDMVW